MTFSGGQLLNSEILQEPGREDLVFYEKAMKKLCADLDREEALALFLRRLLFGSVFANIILILVIIT